MENYEEYLKQHVGKQVLISTVSGRVNGVLYGRKDNAEGKITGLIVKQYLHRTEVPVEEILNIRLLE